MLAKVENFLLKHMKIFFKYKKERREFNLIFDIDSGELIC